MEKTYNITWVQGGEAMPSGLCGKCGIGELRKSKFFEGVYCSECKWKWRRSEFGSDGKKKIIGDVMIMDELKSINERLDKLAEYLKSKLE